MRRSAVTLWLALMLSLPVHAARNFEDRRDRSWFEDQHERIVKIVKRVVKSLGDGITIPTP